MPDPDGVLHFQPFRQRGQVAAEAGPTIRRVRLAAAPMTPEVHRQAAPSGKHADDLVPDAPVKPRSVSKQKRRIRALPFPHGQFQAVSRYDLQRWGEHVRIVP